MLLAYDATRQPVELEAVGDQVWDGRTVRRSRWRRSDRDLTGELVVDIATGIVLCWENDRGRSERITELAIDDAGADIAADPLLSQAPTRRRVGHVRLDDTPTGTLTAWTIKLAGLPPVDGRVPTSASLEQSIAWAHENARSAEVCRDGQRYLVFDDDGRRGLRGLPPFSGTG